MSAGPGRQSPYILSVRAKTTAARPPADDLTVAAGQRLLTADARRGGGEATQRTANPCTPVRIRSAPPRETNALAAFGRFFRVASCLAKNPTESSIPIRYHGFHATRGRPDVRPVFTSPPRIASPPLHQPRGLVRRWVRASPMNCGHRILPLPDGAPPLPGPRGRRAACRRSGSEDRRRWGEVPCIMTRKVLADSAAQRAVSPPLIRRLWASSRGPGDACFPWWMLRSCMRWTGLSLNRCGCSVQSLQMCS